MNNKSSIDRLVTAVGFILLFVVFFAVSYLSITIQKEKLKTLQTTIEKTTTSGTEQIQGLVNSRQ